MRRQARTSSRNPDNSRPARLPLARGSMVTLAGVFALASMATVGCDEEDTTRPVGMGGTGNAGSSGMSGSSGSAGNAGSSGASGSAGMGGDGGSSGGGGSGGDGGSAGDPDAGDGGPIDGGDGGAVVRDRNAIAADFCAKLDAVDPCAPRTDCINAALAEMDGYDAIPTCPAVVTAMFNCWSLAPQEAYVCDADTPNYQSFVHPACSAEEGEFITSSNSGGACP